MTLKMLRTSISLLLTTLGLTLTLAYPVKADTPSPSPTPKTYPHYSSVHVDKPYIALTFDDGPSFQNTPRLLDILKAHHVKATFFVIGKNAKKYPKILQRAAAEGHEIGNHTWDHANLTKLNHDQITQEIQDTSAAIQAATGKNPRVLRPPYGAIKPYISREIVDEYGMKVILWSVDPVDWKSPGSTVVSERILKGVQPGSIVLSHDIKKGTVDAMPYTIEKLQKEGYQFLTVPELIRQQKPLPPKPSPTADRLQEPQASPIPELQGDYQRPSQETKMTTDEVSASEQESTK